jgi:ABC-type multidrug transport system fused ATPase/permease subunit
MIKQLSWLIKEFGFQAKFAWLFILIFLASMLEAVGIAAILPLIGVLLNESFLESMPSFVESFFNIFSATSHEEIILVALIFVILLFSLKTFLSLIAINAQYSLIYSFQNKLGIRILRNFIKDFDFQTTNEESASKITNTIHHEVHLISSVLSNCSMVLIDALMVLFISITILIVGSYISVGIFTLFGILGYLIIKVTGRRLAYFGNERLVMEQKRLKIVTEGLAGIKEIKLFNLYPWFEGIFSDINQVSLNARKKEIVTKSYPRHIFEFFTIFALIGFIMVWVLISDYPMEQLIPVISLFAAAAFKTLPAANRITSSIQSIKFYGSSVETMHGIISKWDASKRSDHKNDDLPSIPIEKITLNNIGFTFRNGKNVFNNVNIDIVRGKKIAIVGDSGSGKSTLVNIICGLLRSSAGTRQLNGNDCEYDEYKRMLSGAVGYVSQKPFLFNATIAENISNFGEIDNAKVKKVLTMVQLDEFAEVANSFIIGENLNNLSGGQAQRIAIARALYQNSQIIILDEPTSALDQKNTDIVNNIIFDLDATIIWISHDIESIKRCDVIYELSSGTSHIKTIDAS